MLLFGHYSIESRPNLALESGYVSARFVANTFSFTTLHLNRRLLNVANFVQVSVWSLPSLLKIMAGQNLAVIQTSMNHLFREWHSLQSNIQINTHISSEIYFFICCLSCAAMSLHITWDSLSVMSLDVYSLTLSPYTDNLGHIRHIRGLCTGYNKATIHQPAHFIRFV